MNESRKREMHTVQNSNRTKNKLQKIYSSKNKQTLDHTNHSCEPLSGVMEKLLILCWSALEHEENADAGLKCFHLVVKIGTTFMLFHCF